MYIVQLFNMDCLFFSRVPYYLQVFSFVPFLTLQHQNINIVCLVFSSPHYLLSCCKLSLSLSLTFAPSLSSISSFCFLALPPSHFLSPSLSLSISLPAFRFLPLHPSPNLPPSLPHFSLPSFLSLPLYFAPSLAPLLVVSFSSTAFMLCV